MKFLATIVAIAGFANIGCVSVKVAETESGLFENQPHLIIDAYQSLRGGNFPNQPLTRKDLKELGFDLSGPNIEVIPGPSAFRRIFGDKVFDSKNGEQRPDIALEKISEYRGFAVPFVKAATTSDRIYFSEKGVRLEGELINIFFLFHGESLCYHEIAHSKVDVYYSRYAFAELLTSIVKLTGGAALNLILTLQAYRSPGLDPFVPIPIPP